MPGKKLNITGTSGRTYNLDDLKRETRDDPTSSLVVQIWKWNPNLPEGNKHKKPNPPNPVLGQIWLSKLIETDSADYHDLLEEDDEE